MAKVEEIRRSQRAEGPATVLTIGTSNPDDVVFQADYPDYYFCITKSNYPDYSQSSTTCQTLLPDFDGAIEGHLKEVDLTFHLLKDVPRIIARNIE